MKFVKPIAKIGDIIIYTKDSDTFVQTEVVMSIYRKQHEDKGGHWAYWVQIYEHENEVIGHIEEYRIKANLTTGIYYHKVK